MEPYSLNLYVEPSWNLELFKSGTFMRNLGDLAAAQTPKLYWKNPKLFVCCWGKKSKENEDLQVVFPPLPNRKPPFSTSLGVPRSGFFAPHLDQLWRFALVILVLLLSRSAGLKSPRISSLYKSCIMLYLPSLFKRH